MDQLSFCIPKFQLLPSHNVPLVGGTENFVSIGINLLKGSSRPRCFPPPLHEVPITMYMVFTILLGPTDPWILPPPLFH